MANSGSALAAAIGARVRAEREARRWTLDRFAELSGVSRRMVVNVEQGTANPSVGTLLRLAEALGVGLPTLVQPPRTAPVTVVRRGEAAVLWSGASGGQARMVATAGDRDVTELWDWVLLPGEVHTGDAHRSGTMELIQVRDGSVTISVDARTVQLDAGDAASFPGDADHSYGNTGDAPARFTLAVHEPGAGSGPRSAEPGPGRSGP